VHKTDKIQSNNYIINITVTVSDNQFEFHFDAQSHLEVVVVNGWLVSFNFTDIFK